MGSNSVLAGIGATVLALTLLVCGFAACCAPVTTERLASLVSTGTGSPYTHEQLVALAGDTRAFTVEPHQDMGQAKELLSQQVLDAARAAAGDAGLGKAGEWSEAARAVINEADPNVPATEVTDALAKVSDRYALDAAAVSHLEDCNALITGVMSWLWMVGLAALIIAILLGLRKQFEALAFMLRMGPAMLLAFLLVLGVWGVVDFNGLFAAFHSLFFVDGSWTFSADSLLISMYPLDFWMGMGAVWLAVAVGLGLICFAGSFMCTWRAQVQARVLEDIAAQSTKKGKKARRK